MGTKRTKKNGKFDTNCSAIFTLFLMLYKPSTCSPCFTVQLLFMRFTCLKQNCIFLEQEVRSANCAGFCSKKPNVSGCRQRCNIFGAIDRLIRTLHEWFLAFWNVTTIYFRSIIRERLPIPLHHERFVYFDVSRKVYYNSITCQNVKTVRFICQRLKTVLTGEMESFQEYTTDSLLKCSN